MCCSDYSLMENKYRKLNKVHASFISCIIHVIPSFFLSASCAAAAAILLMKKNKNDCESLLNPTVRTTVTGTLTLIDVHSV